MRGLGLHGRHQPRQELGIQIVAGRNAESTSRGARVKLPRIAEQPLGCTQNVCRGLHHAQPHIGRLHLCPGTHQQRVASELAQTPQRCRHRRLVHAQPQRCPGDAALRQHRVQHPDQVQIYLVEQGLVTHRSRPSGRCGTASLIHFVYKAAAERNSVSPFEQPRDCPLGCHICLEFSMRNPAQTAAVITSTRLRPLRLAA
jgi:hypothetical protein